MQKQSELHEWVIDYGIQSENPRICEAWFLAVKNF